LITPVKQVLYAVAILFYINNACTKLIAFHCLLFSDPVINSNSNERSSVHRLLEKLILEEDQFDVHDILPNTMPDPASLQLKSDYACPLGQVVMAPDCGK
jgi:hypothetical protein